MQLVKRRVVSYCGDGAKTPLYSVSYVAFGGGNCVAPLLYLPPFTESEGHVSIDASCFANVSIDGKGCNSWKKFAGNRPSTCYRYR